jgi:hypothetical protein
VLSTDRPAFDAQIAVLFGAFPTFLSDARREAYWRGLQKMPPVLFERVVDVAINEEKLPNVHRIWEISRELRQQSSAPRREETDAEKRPLDDFIAHGNRCLLSFLRTNGGATNESLKAMVAAKNKLVDDFRMVCQDEPEAALELRDKLNEAFAKHFVRMTQDELLRHIEHFQRTGYAAA